MNTARLKAYAPKARKDFIKAVTERANYYGIFSDDHIEPIEFKGDMAIVGERAFTKKEGELREKLVDRIKRERFELVMRACAYTWFNRFVALRYMELHDYLEHGYRVLSNNRGSEIPEILEHAADVDFQGLDKDKVVELRLAGNKDNELYRLLLVSQCNALHKAMPFLFEQIDSETELLLPDNLLHSDSPIRKMVNEIDEEDWKNVEIIGWIYQFYISERKDEVIGKVVKSEDIPAATQLFTPNWIVKYMVQNTLGRMWLATYPDSPLKNRMEYYIEPPEQEPKVQKQLDSIVLKELNPEEITFFDPACGSGHILVEAYDIFKEMYLERGYRTKDIPKLILEKNLYGIDIDDRAAQLASLSIIMKARRDDRRLLSFADFKLNVMSICETRGTDKDRVAGIISRRPKGRENKKWIKELLDLYENGKTFGSLINVPYELAERLDNLIEITNSKIADSEALFDYLDKSKLEMIKTAISQTQILSKKYNCIVTNPPYMNNKGMNKDLKSFAKRYYPNSKSDMFSMFVDFILKALKKSGEAGIVMPYVWMFLSSYESFRKKLLSNTLLHSLIQLEYNAFEPACVPVATFTFQNYICPRFKGVFIKLSDFKGHQNQAPRALEAIQNPNCNWRYYSSVSDFKEIPGNPIAYSIFPQVRNCFNNFPKLSDNATLKIGLQTGDTERFLRLWTELSIKSISLPINGNEKKVTKISKYKWFPCNKAGSFRKWYGNHYFVVNWENNGAEIKKCSGSRPQNVEYYFRSGASWGMVTSSLPSARYMPDGFIFDNSAPSLFSSQTYHHLGLINSSMAQELLTLLNPTLNLSVGTVGLLPDPTNNISDIKHISDLIFLSKEDWDDFEISWDFQISPMLNEKLKNDLIEGSFHNWENNCAQRIKRMKELELKNNRFFIEAYNLLDEVYPEASEDQITLARAERTTDIKNLISYAIGCMMGRYSLDQAGLIYAQSGNQNFDSSKYANYPADEDGIIPIMDLDWFPDDATNRFSDFLKVAWSPETLDENLKFVADCLKLKNNETTIDTIRRYLSNNFFKDHIKTYKKRPIYWSFSSGKHKAFECLVYLHRYNESTLSRIRSNYVTPLQGNISARLEFLHNEKDAVGSASAQRKIQKEIDVLRKKQNELSKFDDELRHYADMKISLDLDDGVKVNYGKFGNLLAEKKTITG